MQRMLVRFPDKRARLLCITNSNAVALAADRLISPRVELGAFPTGPGMIPGFRIEGGTNYAFSCALSI